MGAVSFGRGGAYNRRGGPGISKIGYKIGYKISSKIKAFAQGRSVLALRLS